MINVICLKWGTKYGPEYVNRLYAGVKRNTTVDFNFYCFTEDATGIRPEVNILPLPFADKLDSWWNKLAMFSPDLPFIPGTQLFYIDLDTLIVGNIDKFLLIKTPSMMALRDFYHGVAVSAGLVGSGLMAWKHGKYSHVWTKFIGNPEKHTKAAGTYGDQWWIEQKVSNIVFWQDFFPNQVVSFKVHCRKGIPNDARIICYHGRPSIPESMEKINTVEKWTIAPQPWVAQHWRDSVEDCQVRYAELPAREIFGMVGRCGGGYNTLWEDWSLPGRIKRQLIMEEYEQELDKICGHYSKLEKSITEEGIRNPVIITCGYPKRRPMKYLPPELRNIPESELLLLEGTTGGSRLHVAQKLDLLIPCFINDWTGRFKNEVAITSEEQARKYYKDQPATVSVNYNGIVESFDDNKVSYHLGEDWSEEKVMPQRAPMWLSIMLKHGYKIERLSSRVKEVLGEFGEQYFK
jgi:hypothetical protein